MTTETETTTVTQIAEYDATEAKLAELREAYEGATFEVTTTAGMKEAVAARKELKRWRHGLEDIRVKAKAPVLELGRAIDAEAKRITAELRALEEPIDAQIKTETARKAEERRAKLKAEEDRIKAEAEAEARAKREAEEAELQAQRDALAKEREALEAERAAAAAERAAADKAAADARAEEDRKAAEAREHEAAALRQREAALEEERQAQAAKDAEEAKAREAAHIEAATVIDAATAAVELLIELGEAEHLVTRALAAALRRTGMVPAVEAAAAVSA
jgi:DNA repair exonuclease SbcCD ATPase subunit